MSFDDIERMRQKVDRQAEPLTAHLLLWLWRHPEEHGSFGGTARQGHPASIRDMSYETRQKRGVM